jgi:hypothetical protein
MDGPERIHPVPRRGGVEYYREIACPDCGAVVFVLSGEDNPVRYDNLNVFNRHRCVNSSLAGTSGAVMGFPVDLGRVPEETAREFRTAVEAAFGKRLLRFNGAMQGKGLPLYFTNDWKPFLGHVREFSKSDVRREMDRGTAVFKLILPYLIDHFRSETEPSLRKYYLSSKGVTKHRRSIAIRVIAWKWPARY